MSTSIEFNLLVGLIIVLSTISQAIVGVGILLWGTPLLLFMGFGFSEVLCTLLPISITVSFLQFCPNLKKIDLVLIKKFLIFSIPGLVLGLGLVLFYEVDLRPLVALILLASAAIRINFVEKKINNFKQKHDSKFMFFLGIVHGISNLGGSLLMFRLSLEAYDKIIFRSTIAATYFIFALSFLILLYAELIIRYTGISKIISGLFIFSPFILTPLIYFLLIYKFSKESVIR